MWVGAGHGGHDEGGHGARHGLQGLLPHEALQELGVGRGAQLGLVQAQGRHCRGGRSGGGGEALPQVGVHEGRVGRQQGRHEGWRRLRRRLGRLQKVRDKRQVFLC